ncbi:MAG: PQQ-binding-like beta-propeller repeat protein [Halorubrum sp.]
MDRRVLFATLILFAGGATGVGVATFAFVGLDDPTPDATVVWESEPADGDDGSGAATTTVDGETVVVQATLEDGERAVRAVAPGGGVVWRTTIPPGGTGTDGADDDSGTGVTDERDAEPVAISPLTTGSLADDPVVAVTTELGTLVVLDAGDGSERFTVDLDGPSGLAPAIGATDTSAESVDADGSTSDAFVVGVTTDGTVVGVDAAGETLFETAVDGAIDRRPLVVAADADPDGRDAPVEGGVAVTTAGTDPGTVTLFDDTGDVRWRATPSVTATSWNAASTRRGPVLVLGGTNGNVETLEAADGAVRYEVGLQDRPVEVGETDAGRVHVGGVGDVWAVDLLDGEVVWKQQYGGEARVNAPGTGDVTGDGTPNVVAVNRNGDVLTMNRNGDGAARGSVPGAVVYGGPLFADATGDGIENVLVVDEDGVVRALNA